MATYGWITRRFIRDGEVTTEKLASGVITAAKRSSAMTPSFMSICRASSLTTLARKTGSKVTPRVRPARPRPFVTARYRALIS